MMEEMKKTNDGSLSNWDEVELKRKKIMEKKKKKTNEGYDWKTRSGVYEVVMWREQKKKAAERDVINRVGDE